MYLFNAFIEKFLESVVGSIMVSYIQVVQLFLCDKSQDLLLIFVETLPHTKKRIFSGLPALTFQRAKLELFGVRLRGIDIEEEKFELLKSNCIRVNLLEDQLKTVFISSREQIN